MKGYFILKGIARPVFHLLYRLKFTGRENEPVGEPYILCANHTSNIDGIVAGLAVKAQIHYFAKASLFKIPILRHVVKMLGALPVERESTNGGFQAIKDSIALLKAGECVGIFPQGKRVAGVAPENTETKSGVGMIVYHSKCKVLPVCIRTKKWKPRLFCKTEVIVGKPIEYSEFEFTNGRNGEFDRASEYIFSKTAELSKE